MGNYQLLSEMEWELRGSYPDVPFAPGLNIADFSGPNGDKPLFVTLPVAPIGKRSRNGLDWDEAAADRLVEQINSKRPEGILGHIPKEQRGTRYDLPVVRWIGATKHANMVWAKAYVDPTRADVASYFTTAKAAQSRVGVSVYGMRGERGLHDLSLESIDFGHPDRLGNPDASGVPHITAEFEEENQDVDVEKFVAELNASRDGLRDEIAELRGERDKLKQQVAELTTSDATLQAIVAELDGLADADKPVEAVRGLVAGMQQLRQQMQEHEVRSTVAELIQLQPLRNFIVGQIRSQAKADIEAEVKELLERDDIKQIARALVAETSGPPVFAAMLSDDAKGFKIDASPEAIARARDLTGL